MNIDINELDELIESININDSLDDKDRYINKFLLFRSKKEIINYDYYFNKQFDYLIDIKNNKEDIDVLYKLGLAYEEIKDYRQALRCFNKAIKYDSNNDFKAVIYQILGKYYLKGLGTKINHLKAFNYFKKGQEISKFIINKLNIADMYYEGYIEANYHKAFLLYIECLKDTYNYPFEVTNISDRYRVLYRLGRSYYYGLGVKQDINKAYGYMTDALREGYEHVDYDEERKDAFSLYHEIRRRVLLKDYYDY